GSFVSCTATSFSFEGSIDLSARIVLPSIVIPRLLRCVRNASAKNAPGSTTASLFNVVGCVVAPLIVNTFRSISRSASGSFPLPVMHSFLIFTSAVGGMTSYVTGRPTDVGLTVTSMQLLLKFSPEIGAAYQSVMYDLLQVGCTNSSSNARS